MLQLLLHCSFGCTAADGTEFQYEGSTGRSLVLRVSDAFLFFESVASFMALYSLSFICFRHCT